MNMHGLFTQTKHCTPHAFPTAWHQLISAIRLTKPLDQIVFLLFLSRRYRELLDPSCWSLTFSIPGAGMRQFHSPGLKHQREVENVVARRNHDEELDFLCAVPGTSILGSNARLPAKSCSPVVGETYVISSNALTLASVHATDGHILLLWGSSLITGQSWMFCPCLGSPNTHLACILCATDVEMQDQELDFLCLGWNIAISLYGHKWVLISSTGMLRGDSRKLPVC